MTDITSARIAILATDGFEQSELTEPLRQLREAGATVSVVSLKEGEITGWNEKDWGDSVPVDLTLSDAKVADFDALVLPGGQINPDLLRVEKAAVDFIRDFHQTGRPLAAICHAPWLLIEAGIADGRRLTSYSSIRTDVENAGGLWEDAKVVEDANIITSRNPKDLDAFCAKIIERVTASDETRSAA